MTFSLLIFLQTVLIGQFSAVEEMVDKCDDFPSLIISIQDELEGTFIEYGNVNREIGFGCSEKNISFQLDENDYYYNLKALVENDRILAIKMIYRNHENLLIKDRAAIRNYLKAHNTLFKTSKRIKDIEKEFFDTHMFSSGCGFSGEPTKEWIEMEDMCSGNKYESLWNFMSSTNMDIQAYGLIGILRLNKDGFKIPEYDLEIIERIVNRNSDVLTCMGCSPGEVFRLSDLISFYVR
ncbi:MAG: hypothetical protein ACRBG0_18260 [Lewinella sp.]|uniref:hypothetical protein n=1 Tax=Lewinella sp. TaxID=2004506 RepID=UPI003D6C308E